MDNPRVEYCWSCGKKLALPYFTEKTVPKWSGDDIPRILHKSCGKSYDEGNSQHHDVEVHFEDVIEEPDEFDSYGKIWV